MSRRRPLMAVYGGTFDPFHWGHAAICDAVLASLDVTQLRIIPCYVPVLKSEATVSAIHRLQMLESWRQSQPDSGRIVVDRTEIDREGPSYTIDTIEGLKKQFSEFEIVFVLGTDAWNSMPRWNRFNDLAKETSFWVFLRDGEVVTQNYPEIAECRTRQLFLMAGPGHCWKEDSVKIPLSSSEIRNTTEYEHWPVPAPIQKYIKEHNLYR